MKNSLIVTLLFALTTISAQAQGTIKFGNGSTTRINTNAVVGGPALGVTTFTTSYRYALYYSTTAVNVNGITAAISGGANTNYAFNDTNWILVAYGTNLGSGLFASASANGSGATVVPVAGGSAAQFVVIGWAANNVTNLTALQSWFNGGNPAFNGWIGQSAVSGSITLGTTVAATLFGTSPPQISGFTLGLTVPAAPVAPTITLQPANATAAIGANASFSAGAYGTPAPACQWMFNSSNVIAGATNYTLNLHNVQATNAGSYSLFITNTAGSTNSFAATLTVTGSTGTGYMMFANNGLSATKIYTNSTIGGAPTGLTVEGNNLYYYALYASSNATSVNGQNSAIMGSTSSSYAFNDTNWILIVYGTNIGRGLFSSAGASYAGGPTPVPGFSPGTTGQFVVIGWSGNIGTNIPAVQSWFNAGSPASDGWIGQSAVSGPFQLGGVVQTPWLFGTNATALLGFTLGLAAPSSGTAYTVPYAPPAMMQTTVNGNTIQLSWPTAAGSFGVQAASNPAGPWSDVTGLTVTTNGANSIVTVPSGGQNQFYRLVDQ